jgi:hypothetical protein
MKYKLLYWIALVRIRYGLLCGRIGEWFLWQEWKQCTGREEFEEDIKRLRGYMNVNENG